MNHFTKREILPLGLLLISVLWAVYVWGSGTEPIPVHFNIKGEVDRMGERWEIFGYPLVSIGSYLFITYFQRHPELCNQPDTEKLDEEGKRKWVVDVLYMMKVLTLFLFLGVSMASILLPIAIDGIVLVCLAVGIWKTVQHYKAL